MENKKLTQEEIEKLTSLQQKSNNIVAEFGNLEVLKLQMESRKNDLINFYNDLYRFVNSLLLLTFLRKDC